MQSAVFKNNDIVIVGQQAWDVDLGSNCKNIAMEFSKYNRVLYVNPPLDRITSFRHASEPKIRKRIDVIEKKDRGLIQLTKNLWNLYPDRMVESINWLPSSYLFKIFNKRNSLRFGSSIKYALEILQFDDYLLFNDNDLFRSLYLKEVLEPRLSIYYSRDNIVSTKYWGRHGKSIEPQLIAKSDICFSNSEYLRKYCLKYNNNSHYVGQGCDFDILDVPNVNYPLDLKDIKFPIVGYVGALTSQRLDLELIEHIAKSRPGWNIVLVGPEDKVFRSSTLHQYSNIHFLGPKSQYELASYICAFNVCINPQKVNQMTIGNYPRKIDEYLFLGKAVVATDTETMSVFDQHVLLAKNKDEYLNKIEEALSETCEVKSRQRKEFALSHSWANSVNTMASVIQNFLKSKLKQNAGSPHHNGL